jgi:hypothetical protein
MQPPGGFRAPIAIPEANPQTGFAPQGMFMTSFIHQHFAQLSPFQIALWLLYLVAAVMLPLYHIPPTLRYLRGNGGIGDASIRTEVIQCGLRVPALLFSMFVVLSLPLFLSIFLDLLGRIARVWAMHDSTNRWHAQRALAATRPDVGFPLAFAIPHSESAMGAR